LPLGALLCVLALKETYMRGIFAKFAENDTGATEYGLIAVVIITGLTTLGTNHLCGRWPIRRAWGAVPA
jgi:Flp pilus assembly pilin Flp